MANEKQRPTVTFEEIAYSNMLTLNALVELLNERGILKKQDVLDRIKELKARTAINREK